MEYSEEQRKIISDIVEWINGRSKTTPIGILSGEAGTGKTTLISGILKEIPNNSFCLCAPTGRASRVLNQKTKNESSTIHKIIYELDIKKFEKNNQNLLNQLGNEVNREFDTSGFYMPFRLKNPAESKTWVYIIDESSMIYDKVSNSQLLSFGSGRLLHDLMIYTNILYNSRPATKILFVGDSFQLPPVGDIFSPALDKNYFINEFKRDPAIFKLNTVFRQKEQSLILKNSRSLRKKIENNEFSNFSLTVDHKTVFHSNFIGLHDYVTHHQFHKSVVITYKNSTALKYNRMIRHKIFGEVDPPIQKNDILVVTKNSSLGFFNGDLLKVDEVGDKEIQTINVKGSDKPIKLYYRNLSVKYIDDAKGQIFNTFIIENILNNSNSLLTLEEYQAQLIDFRKRNKDLKSNGDDFKNRILKDKYVNALLVKYGFAITCHKAQGGEWEKVFVDFESIQKNESFYRWTYTAVTRSKEYISLLINKDFIKEISGN